VSEAHEQIKLVDWCDQYFRIKHKELLVNGHSPLVATPNEGKRSPMQGAKAKKMGLRPGFLDLQLLVERGGYRGLIIEMKFGKNKTTDNQKAWIDWFENNNFKTAVHYSFESAKNEILKYMIREKGVSL